MPLTSLPTPSRKVIFWTLGGICASGASGSGLGFRVYELGASVLESCFALCANIHRSPEPPGRGSASISTFGYRPFPEVAPGPRTVVHPSESYTRSPLELSLVDTVNRSSNNRTSTPTNTHTHTHTQARTRRLLNPGPAADPSIPMPGEKSPETPCIP